MKEAAFKLICPHPEVPREMILKAATVVAIQEGFLADGEHLPTNALIDVLTDGSATLDILLRIPEPWDDMEKFDALLAPVNLGDAYTGPDAQEQSES